MIPKATLQRFRFYDMDPGLIPTDVSRCLPRFNLDLWKGKGRTVYWKGESPNVGHLKDHVEVDEGSSISSDTFFNAFFLTYWRRLTRLQTLSLTFEFEGRFLLEIFRHTETGDSELLASCELEEDGPSGFDFDSSMLLSGLRLSFTLTSLQKRSRLGGGSWQTSDALNPVCLGIVISTFGRNAFAERVIQRILQDPVLEKEDIRIIVTDQNKNSELGHLNQGRCRIVSQNNLGCAGGLTRGIYESLYGEDSFGPSHIMILDDDIDLETDSILRAIRIMQLAKAPFIMGGIMLDLYRPNFALCQGESFALNDDHFHSLRRNLADTDIADFDGLNSFSIPFDFDYTAGWFCLFPAELFQKIGFQMPLFIQGFEDAEFCLRARTQGYSTFTIPGIGVWHMPFYSKTAAGWKQLMSYYHRLVHHSLYGYEECFKFFFQLGSWAMGELMRGQYRHAAATVRALENFLRGWSYFCEITYPDYLQDIQQYLALYDANEKASGVADKTQIKDLRKRLEIVVSQFEKEGRHIQQEYAAHLPSTFTLESWKGYFSRGNLSALLPEAAVK